LMRFLRGRKLGRKTDGDERRKLGRRTKYGSAGSALFTAAFCFAKRRRSLAFFIRTSLYCIYCVTGLSLGN